jgi:gliding motility-associated-like protein
MKQRHKILFRFSTALLASFAFFMMANGQALRPANEDFSFWGTNNPIPARIVHINMPGNPEVYYSCVSPAIADNKVMFLGMAPGSLFRPVNNALTFNYTTGGVIPGADVSATGTGGDYRIHFVGSSDTMTAKSGNFKMQSMYLAIGQGNSATVTVRGFRAGRMVAEKQIVFSPGMAASAADAVSFQYSAADAYVGTTLTFGTAFQFLDGLQFSVNDRAIPLSIDDLVFADPVAYNALQASDIGFTNTGGISSKISWTPGGGDRVAVFMAAANAGSAAPVNNTVYTANATFGSGSQIGSTGWYCVYNGVDGQANPSTNVYGLTPGTIYRTMVVSLIGTAGWQSYNTTTASLNVANFTTVAAPATQASNITVAPTYSDFRAASISWTNGDGVKRAVFVKNNTPGQTVSSAVSPLNNNYNADAQHFSYTAFTDSVAIPASSSARVGTSGWYCVYNGTGTSVNMSRISVTPGQTLRVMVVEYNGAAGGETYNTATGSNVVDFFNPNFPLPVTNAATSVTAGGATINGSIDPRNANITSARYQYSTSSTLASVLGTITTLTPAATSVLGSASPTGVSASLTGLSPSTVYYYRLAATSNAGTLTATNNTAGATNGINSFTTAPGVNSVSATTGNGYYKAGEVITLTVVFSAGVTVTGTPTIALNSGGSAFYASGSGTATLLFTYTIGAGDTNADLDYTTVSALALSGGTIVDASANNAALVLPAVGGANSLGGQKNIVIDTQAPLVSTVTIASSNANAVMAKPGDVVTISFASDETIVIPTAIIAGHPLSATATGGNNWSVSYTITGLDAEGLVVFEIPFTDLAHNNGVTATGTTNAGIVTFDKTPPVLSTVRIASDNINTALAKAGDVVTVSFTSNEGIATPTGTIAGHVAPIVNTGGNNWAASYTMAAGDAGGQVPFTLSFIDIPGNAGTMIAATTNSSTVIFDKTSPLLSTVTIASNNSNTTLAKAGDVIAISFTADETIATPTATIAGHAAAIANTGGNNWTASYTLSVTDAESVISFSVSATDLSGNTGAPITATTNGSAVRFDKTSPLLSTVTIASNNSNTTLAKPGDVVTVGFVTDETIATPTATIAGHAAAVANIGGNNWTAFYTLSVADADGTLPFSISCTDLSGNTGAIITATTNGSAVRFDKTSPLLSTVTVASNNSNTALAKTGDVITVGFVADETIATPTAMIAGHAAAVANTGGNNWTASCTLSVADAEGAVSFSVSCTDLSGNTGATTTATTNGSGVNFDRTIPALSTVSIGSDNTNATVARIGNIITVNFTSAESITTPSVVIAGHAATVNHIAGNNWRASYAMTGTDGEGAILFAISFTDLNGNAGAAVASTTNGSAVYFDKTIPVLSTVTITSNNANGARAKTGDMITLKFTGSEALLIPVVTISGQTVPVNPEGGNNWTTSYSMTSADASGTIVFTIAFSDLAGNAGTIVATTTNNSNVVFDKLSPLLTVVTIASANSIPSLAKTGDLITLSFTSYEAIMAPVVTIAGRTAAFTNTGANNWIAATSMVDTDPEGVVRFAIAVTDLAGNTALSVTTTSNASRVLYDKTAPSVVSIVRQSPLSERVGSGTAGVIYRVRFSEAVKNITVGAFVLTTSGATTGVITAVSAGSGTVVDVTVSPIAGNGTIRLDLANTGTTITDTAGNPANGGFISGEIYGIGVSPISFTTPAPALSLCVGANAASLNDLLRANGGDNGQTLTWTISSGPAHGAINGFPATSVISGLTSVPTGLTYLATSGYEGNDEFTVQVSDGFINATATLSISIHAMPVASIVSSQGTVLCGASSLVLSANGGVSFAWYKDGTAVPNITGAQLTVDAMGTYSVVATAATGCTGTVGNSIVITQLQKPTAAFVHDAYCVNKAISFTNQSIVNNSGAVTYSWDNGNLVTGTLTSPVFTYPQPGTYTIKLTVTPTTCPALADVISKTITIETSLPGIRMPTQNVAINSPVALQARNGISYQWLPSTGLRGAASQTTTAIISAEQQYTVAVVAASGCTTVDTILLRAFMQYDILLPNVFSPNNDGQNDKLVPNLVGISSFHYLRIFNRFGKKVYESSNPNEGWDGKLNGINQPTETYNWVAEGVDKNGTTVRKQGAVTILR